MDFCLKSWGCCKFARGRTLTPTPAPRPGPGLATRALQGTRASGAQAVPLRPGERGLGQSRLSGFFAHVRMARVSTAATCR
ncbi:hypothetical protein XarbCFBP8132_20230 [Xanthomonas arboricola]|nr:hypothetical protein XarbCFBP8132_20230 [Xanthomonas arboricola]